MDQTLVFLADASGFQVVIASLYVCLAEYLILRGRDLDFFSIIIPKLQATT
jgi:hypothetical protein